jgi:hypothetical protein
MGVSKAVILADGYDLSAYLRSIGSGFEVDEVEKTTFADRTDRKWKPGLSAANLSGEGLYDHDNVLLDAIDDVLPTAVRGSTLFLVAPDGDELGQVAVGFQAFRTSQEIGNDIAELSTVSFEARNEEGRERGVVLHALGQEIATADGDEVDELDPTLLGGVAHLHVLTTNLIDDQDPLEVAVEHSDDALAWAPLASFTNVEAARTSERVAVQGTIERYLRATWVLPTDASATFIVAFARN